MNWRTTFLKGIIKENNLPELKDEFEYKVMDNGAIVIHGKFRSNQVHEVYEDLDDTMRDSKLEIPTEFVKGDA